ncbi:MAG: zinc metallopeptidase [Anaerolineae bacterium]|nr:zinc metallopeptidase [Anaerolineae bacterium]
MGFFGGSTSYMLYVLPALLLSLLAQIWVQNAYRKYQRVPNGTRTTGLDAARRILSYTGLQVQIEGTPGTLSDHYDPRSKTLRLSPGVANQPSVASLAIVAHEIGHAQQDASAFSLLKLRTGLVPMVNFTSRIGPLLFLAGLLLRIYDLAWIGVFCFAGAVLFSLITLPVELDASRRAMALLNQAGLVTGDAERRGARTVLTAASLTYAAALAQSLSTLFYYTSILGGGRRRR